MKLKPLIWKKNWDWEYHCEILYFVYVIHSYSSPGRWDFRVDAGYDWGINFSNHPTLEEAFAAAEEHHQRVIMELFES